MLAAMIFTGVTGAAAIFTSHLRGWWPQLLLAAHLASIAATVLLLWRTLEALPK